MESRWDGGINYKTKNCENCEFYRIIRDSKEKIEICGWGVAFKFLYKKEKMRSCDLLRREQTDNPSINRINNNQAHIIKIWRRMGEKDPIQLKLI